MATYKCDCGNVLDPDIESNEEDNYMITFKELCLATKLIENLKNSEDLGLVSFGLITDRAQNVLHCKKCDRLLFLDEKKRGARMVYKLEFKDGKNFS